MERGQVFCREREPRAVPEHTVKRARSGNPLKDRSWHIEDDSLDGEADYDGSIVFDGRRAESHAVVDEESQRSIVLELPEPLTAPERPARMNEAEFRRVWDRRRLACGAACDYQADGADGYAIQLDGRSEPDAV